MNDRFPEAAVFAPEDLKPGLIARFEHEITEAGVAAFARLSGDENPLHVDAGYASGTNLGARIVHGAYQVGLASALVGMHLPGRNVLLGSINARFPAPLYYPCRVVVSGELTSWNAAARAGTVRVTVIESASHAPTADVQMHVGWHEQRLQPDRGAVQVPVSGDVARDALDPGREIVLVTGAGGGIGSELVASLEHEYTVVAMTRRQGGAERGPNVIEMKGDLQEAGWRESLQHLLQGRRLHAIVHAAWPGHPHGSLLQIDPCVVQQQLTFAALSTTELARFLFAQGPAPDGRPGGRLVVLGSVAGTLKPALSEASYSLGKAALEHTVRLLAPELARRQITVNVISPSFIAAGMNRQATDRQQMKAAALVPLGRLCQSGDVAGLVRFLLSPDSSFLSGQVIGLTGAQL